MILPKTKIIFHLEQVIETLSKVELALIEHNDEGSQTEVLKWGEQFKYNLKFNFNSPISKAELAVRIRTTEGICVSGIQVEQKDMRVGALGPDRPLII